MSSKLSIILTLTCTSLVIGKSILLNTIHKPVTTTLVINNEGNQLQLQPQDSTDNNPQAIVMDLYEKETRENKQIWTVGVMYARQPACTFNMETAVMVAVTLYSNIQVVQRQVQAYHCIRKDQIFLRQAGAYIPPKYYVTLIQPISKRLCEYMVTHTVTKNNEYMHEINSTWRGTTNTFSMTLSELSIKEAKNYTITNYYYHHVNLSIDPDSGHMTHPYIKLNKNCTYETGWCNTDMGTIIWNVKFERNKPAVCTTQLQKADICWINNSSMICPELAITFLDHNRDHEEICGYKLGYFRGTVSKENIDSRTINQLDLNETLTLRFEYSHLFDQIKTQIEKPVYIKLIHMGQCDAYPQDLIINSPKK